MNRRRPFNRTPDYTGEPLSSLGKKELMNLAYYLYQITDGMHNEQIFNNENAYKMFFSLVKLLEVTDRFYEILEVKIQDLENEGLLNLYVETEDEETGMKRSRRHYKYFEDYDISDVLEVEITEAGEPSRNYFRCLFCEQKGTFAKLLGYTFFSDLPPVSCMDSCSKISIPKAVKKNAESYEQIKFLSDAFELSVNESRYLLQRYRRSTIQGYGDLIDSLVKNPRDKYCKLLGISSSEY
ncbi:MAG: hypothetical protein MJ188_12520, partial [Treponema sp.]|nr:hypothetical protein [Treponema sp.]